MRSASFVALALLVPALTSAAEGASLPEGAGLAAGFVADQGLAKHPSVIFVEDFEGKTVAELKGPWTSVGNQADALTLDSEMRPDGSAGSTSLRITGRKGHNEGGYLYKILDRGYDEVFARIYVRFHERYGLNHHFCKLGGDIDPKPWPVGRAGQRAETWFMTGLEPVTGVTHTWPPTSVALPGAWMFYTYYPAMHSWQTEHGATNGKPNAYYGNRFSTAQPQAIERGTWICLEWSIRLNTAPDNSDGAQRFWVDGKLIGNWEPGTPNGYWMRENFRIRPDQPERSKPFEGFQWRTDMAVQINQFKLENYVSQRTFEQMAKHLEQHPDSNIDAEASTVWFDHVVLATEYIGPMGVKKSGR